MLRSISGFEIQNLLETYFLIFFPKYDHYSWTIVYSGQKSAFKMQLKEQRNKTSKARDFPLAPLKQGGIGAKCNVSIKSGRDF